MTIAILSKSPAVFSKPQIFPIRKATLATLIVIAACFTITSSAQTLTTLVTLDAAQGSFGSIAPMIQNVDGNFYGTTEEGGTGNPGTVFKLTPQGTLTTLYSFCEAASGCGSTPLAALVRGSDGFLYGTTMGSGSSSCDGTVFKITTQGMLTTLYDFCSQQTTGALPQAALVQAQDGNFYGTTAAASYDLGTLFRITSQGQLTTIHTFCGLPNCADGSFPTGPGLLLAADGRLYGITNEGGAYERGVVFRSTLAGSVTPLHSFCANSYCTDGTNPMALVQAIDGTIYGVTYFGGQYVNCSINGNPAGCGTVFKIKTTGQFSVVHSFCQTLDSFYCADGDGPTSLVLGSDGNLYGTTQNGGDPTNGGRALGTIFQMTPDGTVTTLHTFCIQNGCPDGASPGNLVQSTDGNFYGATESSPSTIFKLSAGLPPFVKTAPRFGKVGASVLVVGNNLSTATSVSFNGSAAEFSVLSNSEIKATVPEGAASGQVTVTTAQGALASDVVFSVVP